MESKILEYSLKNIPIPSKASYLKSMMDKVENFIKRIRWKGHFVTTHRLLGDNITSNYRKWENGVKGKIDEETKKVAESFDLSKKNGLLCKPPCFYHH